MFKKLGAVVLLLALVAAGCAKKADVAGSESALRAADEEWAKTGRTADGFAAFFTADGVLMPPNQPSITGLDNIRAFAQQLMELPGFALTWQPSHAEVAQSGELGFTTGTFTMSMQGANGTMSDTGKYLTVWKKDATGAWKVVYDTFNSNTPLVAPSAPVDSSATPSK
ncbi:MAG TPA: DUF4440 domain-containing protein [Candidatus Krumholzibacteria bacterium]